MVDIYWASCMVVVVIAWNRFDKGCVVVGCVVVVEAGEVVKCDETVEAQNSAY